MSSLYCTHAHDEGPSIRHNPPAWSPPSLLPALPPRSQVASDPALHCALHDAALRPPGDDAPSPAHVFAANLLIALHRLLMDPHAGAVVTRSKKRIELEATARRKERESNRRKQQQQQRRSGSAGGHEDNGGGGGDGVGAGQVPVLPVLSAVARARMAARMAIGMAERTEHVPHPVRGYRVGRKETGWAMVFGRSVSTTSGHREGPGQVWIGTQPSGQG